MTKVTEVIKYYVSDHLDSGVMLHTEGCQYLPPSDSRAFIGSCYRPHQALKVAETQYVNVQYCPFCLPEAREIAPLPLITADVHFLCKSSRPARKSGEKEPKSVRN